MIPAGSPDKPWFSSGQVELVHQANKPCATQGMDKDQIVAIPVCAVSPVVSYSIGYEVLLGRGCNAPASAKVHAHIIIARIDCVDRDASVRERLYC